MVLLGRGDIANPQYHYRVTKAGLYKFTRLVEIGILALGDPRKITYEEEANAFA